jgi:hypothetical protein
MTIKLTDEQLNELYKQQNEREAQLREKVVQTFKSGVLPTPEDVVQIVTWRVGPTREALIRHHSYWKEHRLRIGLDALISAALAAHLDLCRCDAALSAYAQSRDRFEDHIDHTVVAPAQKEVMAFCAAYFGINDTLRRLKSARPDIGTFIEAAQAKDAQGPAFKFILDLRKNLSHGSVTVPNWSISSDFRSTSGAMVFATADLLAFGEWGRESREFLEAMPCQQFQVAEIAAVCAKGLAKFGREMRTIFSQHPTAAEMDFNQIQDMHRRTSSRQFMKIFLEPYVKNSTDPYLHLHQFFAPEEVREILRRPPHSVEQVELIIALRSPTTDCDDELRTSLYRLFKVEAPPPSSAPAELLPAGNERKL